MESAGHAPDIYHDDENEYYFGTCSTETPESARNCVYDKGAAHWFRENTPNHVFNGSAVEMAEAMRIELMQQEHYMDILQQKGKFDKETESLLLTQSDIKSSGRALYGYRRGSGVFVYRDGAYSQRGCRAWRGVLRVKKLRLRLYSLILVVGREGFEPSKAKPADLQSALFDRFSIDPLFQFADRIIAKFPHVANKNLFNYI